MRKSDEGFTVIDTIIALLILSISLTSVYSLLTKSMKLEHRLSNSMDEIIVAGEEYDKQLEKAIR